ncbi:hypothetical protein XENTR_v10014222 [Xenopus tropicalis]|nr:hypothetical protein XENTR_v10014222 [Xenopus tropicalis]
MGDGLSVIRRFLDNGYKGSHTCTAKCMASHKSLCSETCTISFYVESMVQQHGPKCCLIIFSAYLICKQCLQSRVMSRPGFVVRHNAQRHQEFAYIQNVGDGMCRKLKFF